MTLVKFNHQAPRHLNNWVNRFIDEDFQESFFGGFPPTNIYDHKDHYTIEVAAPGREKNDFKVQVDRNLLVISQEQKEQSDTTEGRNVRKEFSLKTFKRSFTLDEKIDVEGIVAKYENGILKLTLPKKEEVKDSSKEISVL
ncbi:Hsp20/alpha crystallin family protein [Dinghuibacter silviterrae]|uniref:HSP20 family protein n=1 Tax=Dinghuibacter silviterrae TaxID=1539049 RepID=A0A4R8DV06_9BACT|nr:Hsp20/alpha crystallin family protein [Dinghuibacter silviterrae]TDX02242.1 HSP20 family protein [Dinghuibacter silviterrae]